MGTFEAWLGSPYPTLAVGLVLIVAGQRLADNYANATLLAAWCLLAYSAFRLPGLSGLDPIPRVLAVMTFAGIVGLGLYYTLWTRAESSDQVSQQASDVPIGIVPVVLDWHVVGFNSQKTVTTYNRGKVDVSDLRVHAMQWVLDPKAWAQNQIQIATFSSWSGGPTLISEILKAGRDHVLDLTSEKPFIGVKVLPFPAGKIPEGRDAILPPELMTFYSLRFTFRDVRSGERYHHYEVVSAQSDTLLPINPDSAIAGSSSPRIWARELAPRLIEAAEEHYAGDNSKRYPSN